MRLAILLWLLLPCGASAWAQMPGEFNQARDDMFAGCRAAGGRPQVIRHWLSWRRFAFVRRFDLNGDGRTDYLLDGAELRCRGAEGHFCGDGGCDLMMVVSKPPGYRRVLQLRAHSLSFGMVDGRQVIELGMDRGGCGPPGSVACLRLRWQGSGLCGDGRQAAALVGRACTGRLDDETSPLRRLAHQP